MPTLEAYHHYSLKKAAKKFSRHIESIIPMEDREVDKKMFDEYEETGSHNNQRKDDHDDGE